MMRNSFLSNCATGIVCSISLLLAHVPAQAADRDLVLAVQPILDPEHTRQAFQPLCDYLAKATQRNCTIFTSTHFYPYWEAARQGKEFNLVLDAAHFTDYRLQKLGFQVLAKVPDSVTYSLVTDTDTFIVDPSELVGKRVATLGIPSIGAARLNSMFPKPTRQPVTIEVRDAETGIKMLETKKVVAALLPTPIVSQQMARGAKINVVLTTDPIPHIGLSASPSVDSTTREAIRRALVRANQTEDGKAMLKAIGFERFDAATPSIYKGNADLLQQYWGF